eukprot:9816126-Alexandrium_andersonii.AAC.1
MAKKPPASARARDSRSAARKRVLPRSTAACSWGARPARPQGHSRERTGRGPGHLWFCLLYTSDAADDM